MFASPLGMRCHGAPEGGRKHVRRRGKKMGEVAHGRRQTTQSGGGVTGGGGSRVRPTFSGANQAQTLSGTSFLHHFTKCYI